MKKLIEYDGKVYQISKAQYDMLMDKQSNRPTMTLLEKICLSIILLFSTIFLVFILYLIFH